MGAKGGLSSPVAAACAGNEGSGCTRAARSQRDPRAPRLHSSCAGPARRCERLVGWGQGSNPLGSQKPESFFFFLIAVAGLGTNQRRPLQSPMKETAPRNLITCYIYVAHFILKAFYELNDVQTTHARILSSATDCSCLRCEGC